MPHQRKSKSKLQVDLLFVLHDPHQLLVGNGLVILGLYSFETKSFSVMVEHHPI